MNDFTMVHLKDFTSSQRYLENPLGHTGEKSQLLQKVYLSEIFATDTCKKWDPHLHQIKYIASQLTGLKQEEKLVAIILNSSYQVVVAAIEMEAEADINFVINRLEDCNLHNSKKPVFSLESV